MNNILCFRFNNNLIDRFDLINIVIFTLIFAFEIVYSSYLENGFFESTPESLKVFGRYFLSSDIYCKEKQYFRGIYLIYY